MAKRVQLIRQNETDAGVFVGLEGEITVDLTNDNLIVHDGALAGGFPVARGDLLNAPAASVSQDGKMTAAQVQLLATAAGIVASLEGQVGGFLTKTISGPVSLSDVEADNLFIRFVGTLGADATITFPSAQQVHYIQNDTLGGFNINCLMLSGGVNIKIPPEQTDYIAADDSSPKEFFAPMFSYEARGAIRGLDGVWKTVSTIDYELGSVVDDKGAYAIIFDSVTTLDVTGTGVNGLDAGSIATNTPYYVFAIGDDTGVNAPGVVASTSLTAPAIPGGYNRKALIGFFHTEAAATDIAPFSHSGDMYRYQTNKEVLDSLNPALTGTATIPTFIPLDIVSSWTCRSSYERGASGTNEQVIVKINDSYMGIPSGLSDITLADIALFLDGSDQNIQVVNIEFPRGDLADKTLAYRIIGGGTNYRLRLAAVSFKFNRNLS